ncbi:hypothetical protein EJ08DRAFT_470851 [Tothia fuscella]|uniref:F-box domain-containing protein n=1 Tax=Tothia fuscella TaxID=1048955 RepID=A0A9P4NZK1_9PEZI|nr:hypothetical protein EJ08DRAFT_470851 [Tothia fuscella]
MTKNKILTKPKSAITITDQQIKMTSLSVVPTTFMSLPLELREMVYRNVVVCGWRLSPVTPTNCITEPSLESQTTSKLLSISKTISNEVLQYFYKYNTLDFRDYQGSNCAKINKLAKFKQNDLAKRIAYASSQPVDAQTLMTIYRALKDCKGLFQLRLCMTFFIDVTINPAWVPIPLRCLDHENGSLTFTDFSGREVVVLKYRSKKDKATVAMVQEFLRYAHSHFNAWYQYLESQQWRPNPGKSEEFLLRALVGEYQCRRTWKRLHGGRRDVTIELLGSKAVPKL